MHTGIEVGVEGIMLPSFFWRLGHKAIRTRIAGELMLTPRPMPHAVCIRL